MVAQPEYRYQLPILVTTLASVRSFNALVYVINEQAGTTDLQHHACVTLRR